MKLTLASLPTMMLPYRIDFTVTVLIVTAIMCTAIDLAKERFGPVLVSRNFIFAPLLHHSLKSRPLSDNESATK